MRPCSRPGAAPEPRLPQGGAAVLATPGPGGAGTLAARLAAVEAGIRDDRHRQPAAVVEAIARLWTAGAAVPAIAAETGVSPHIVQDRLRRAGVLGDGHRDRRRHVREVLERQGARLIAEYEAGASVHALAADAGISGSALRRYLAAEGVALRRTRGRARKVLAIRGAELMAAYEGGRDAQGRRRGGRDQRRAGSGRTWSSTASRSARGAGGRGRAWRPAPPS